MKVPAIATVLIALLSTAALAQTASKPAQVTPLVAKDLDGLPNKEGVLLKVRYEPGGADPVHRHNAYVFVYVLEGSIVMQVRGGQEMTLRPGDTFVESPGDVHTVGRNASSTEPATFLAFFVKDKGAPPVLPAQ